MSPRVTDRKRSYDFNQGVAHIRSINMVGFHRQLAILILHSFNHLDSETCHNNVLFTMATGDIAKIQLYYKKCDFFF